MTYKGFFRPKHPEKYKGNPTNIVYRSQWELVMMLRFDGDKNVKWWQSEELYIPYMNPVKGRLARYFPDFRVQYIDGKEVIIEVKPKKETVAPVQLPKKTKKALLKEWPLTYAVNERKWEAARQYCAHRGIEFKILTEDEIFGRG